MAVKEDRKRAEQAADKISDRILKTSPGDRWNMMADVIEAALDARDKKLVAAVREVLGDLKRTNRVSQKARERLGVLVKGRK